MCHHPLCYIQANESERKSERIYQSEQKSVGQCEQAVNVFTSPSKEKVLIKFYRNKVESTMANKEKEYNKQHEILRDFPEMQ